MWSDSCCMQHSTSDCITVNTFRCVLRDRQRSVIGRKRWINLNWTFAFKCRTNTFNAIQEVWIQYYWMTFSSRCTHSLRLLLWSANALSMKFVLFYATGIAHVLINFLLQIPAGRATRFHIGPIDFNRILPVCGHIDCISLHRYRSLARFSLRLQLH